MFSASNECLASFKAVVVPAKESPGLHGVLTPSRPALYPSRTLRTTTTCEVLGAKRNQKNHRDMKTCKPSSVDPGPSPRVRCSLLVARRSLLAARRSSQFI